MATAHPSKRVKLSNQKTEMVKQLLVLHVEKGDSHDFVFVSRIATVAKAFFPEESLSCGAEKLLHAAGKSAFGESWGEKKGGKGTETRTASRCQVYCTMPECTFAEL
jgi:hypothetical protein